MLVFAHDQDRTRGLVDNLLGVTALDDAAQPSAIVRRDDDQIDSKDPRHSWDVSSRLTAAKERLGVPMLSSDHIVQGKQT
jgi:hypothetical protein